MPDYAIFGVTIADVAQLDRAFGYEPKGSRFESTIADVAQLDRAFGYEPKGSRFESWHPQKEELPS